MPPNAPAIVGVDADDLPAINAIVEAAIQTWDLPDRVKRLAMPSYRYDPHDLAHLTLVQAVAEDKPLAVAAWEPAESTDNPPGRQLLLLHGLYVHPAHWRHGLGRTLIDAALSAADQAGLDGVLVKAQADAEPYFVQQGFLPLPASDARRDYAHRLWHPVPG